MPAIVHENIRRDLRNFFGTRLNLIGIGKIGNDPLIAIAKVAAS
jgi:hypothetical protein